MRLLSTVSALALGLATAGPSFAQFFPPVVPYFPPIIPIAGPVFPIFPPAPVFPPIPVAPVFPPIPVIPPIPPIPPFPGGSQVSLNDFKHIVVIYQENHSFDNLYGHWGNVEGDDIEGVEDAPSVLTTQKGQNGQAFGTLTQLDVNLTSTTFANKPFAIERYITRDDRTCPKPGAFFSTGILKTSDVGLPGGCTMDIVHRFYNEQFQIHGGKQDRYVLGSDAAGLAMGYYDTKNLPIYQYLHSHGAPNYVIADNFFQGAFGGSFLNHQWLIAGAAPKFVNAAQPGQPGDSHSVVDDNGMPATTPLYTPATTVSDNRQTVVCDVPGRDYNVLKGTSNNDPDHGRKIACGDFAVNTTQPWTQPYSPGTADNLRLPLLHTPNIGDSLSARGVDWAWYSGGWSNATGQVGAPGWTNGFGNTCIDPNANKTTTFPLCPDLNFQFHHQAFGYFANYAEGTAGRKQHLLDEAEFFQAARTGRLKAVSFIKPVGEENEHPGYASEVQGSDHLVDLIQAIVDGPDGKDTLIVITYDEFGGQWDHVPPPKGDVWGPGTRIPAILIADKFKHSGVSHVSFDTTSIIKTIEERFGLWPLQTRQVKSLSAALAAAK